MGEKLSWFAAGAMLTAVVMFAVAHVSDVADVPTTGPSDNAQIGQRLDAIERTLDELVRRERGAEDSKVASDQRRTDAPLQPPGRPDARDVTESATVASRAAAEKAAAIVDGAIGAGYWSRRNAQELLAASGQISAEDRLELYRKLSAAINDDRVKVEAGALPR